MRARPAIRRPDWLDESCRPVVIRMSDLAACLVPLPTEPSADAIMPSKVSLLPDDLGEWQLGCLWGSSRTPRTRGAREEP
jgi:hypothetical protein